ncbi:uncharacterized protein EV154DRAFT_489031, partial [Mucor mucedo]|uniref:uncharacterized protein n=1 Tax=Mucor mucedo TaxID=29922 RepID=UPI00221FE073
FHNLVELNAEIRDQALSCNVCEYSTDRRSNHTRHLSSESHRLNVANAILSNANNPNEVQNEAINTDPSPEVQEEAYNSMNIDSPSGSPMMTDIDVEPEPEPDITLEEAFGSSHGFEEDDSEIGRDFDPFENILNDEVQLDGGPGVSESINPNTNDDEPQVPDDSSSMKYSEEEIKATLEFGRYLIEIAIRQYKDQLALDPTRGCQTLKKSFP